MLEWLADNVSVFKMQHNAHREFHMSVEQHLRHRDRIGDSPVFLGAKDRETCVANGELWELRIIMPDGATMDFAGSSLGNCIHASRRMVTSDQSAHMAA
jgi:hypothetical protein